MKFQKTHLQDAMLIAQDKFIDERGMFMEAYRKGKWNMGVVDMPNAQANFSTSIPGVLRGLHIQRVNPQGKMVQMLKGRILDVIVDLRKDSTTFKKWGAFELSSDRPCALWVPPGFAHGFYAYESSMVYYLCSTEYDHESDGGILWNDPELGITWPSECPIMSKKDKNLPTMAEWLNG